MPLTIEDKGRRNRILIPPACLDQLHGVVRITGDDNVITMGEGCVAKSLDVEVKDGVQVVMGNNCRLGGLRIFALAGARVSIGSNTIFNGRTRLLLHEARAITIGERCLFGGDCTLTVSDMHSVLDAASRERINPAQDVVIGNHVWLGESVMVLKGASVAENSVVGARALVAGDIPAGSLAVGVPARVVRSAITWDNRLL